LRNREEARKRGFITRDDAIIEGDRAMYGGGPTGSPPVPVRSKRLPGGRRQVIDPVDELYEAEQELEAERAAQEKRLAALSECEKSSVDKAKEEREGVATADELQDDIDALKNDFEKHQDELRKEVGKQLGAISEFTRNYNDAWNQTMDGIDDYFRKLKTLKEPLSELWKARKDRDRALMIANAFDDAFVIANLAEGAAKLAGKGLGGVAKAVGGEIGSAERVLAKEVKAASAAAEGTEGGVKAAERELRAGEELAEREARAARAAEEAAEREARAFREAETERISVDKAAEEESRAARAEAKTDVGAPGEKTAVSSPEEILERELAQKGLVEKELDEFQDAYGDFIRRDVETRKPDPEKLSEANRRLGEKLPQPAKPQGQDWGSYDPTLPRPTSDSYAIEDRIEGNWRAVEEFDESAKRRIAEKYQLDPSRPIAEQVENLTPNRKRALGEDLERASGNALSRGVAEGKLSPIELNSEEYQLISDARIKGRAVERNPAEATIDVTAKNPEGAYQKLVEDIRKRYDDPNSSFREALERGVVRVEEEGIGLQTLATREEQALIRKMIGRASEEDLRIVEQMTRRQASQPGPGLAELMKTRSGMPTPQIDPKAETMGLPPESKSVK
jgi:hypothetical protein